MKLKIYLSIVVFASLYSCEKVFMEPNPEIDNISIFEEYWKLVNEKFAMFDDPGKAINKKTLYDSNRALVNNDISQDSLFNVISNITLGLKDGHSFLENPNNGRFSSYSDPDAPINLEQSIVDEYYLNNDVRTEGPGLRYTLLKNGTIGFIEYRDFENEVNNAMMNNILTYFENTIGIILDVRGNGGGDPSFAALMASHITDTEKHIGYEKFKTGPNPDDFSISQIYLKPTKGKVYKKPLKVLTDIDCFSATTTLIYHLNPLANVIFIGGRTGGGSGSAADGYLANGWKWGISTTEFIDWEERRLDNGFNPDIAVNLDKDVSDKDEIIERAIYELQ